MSAQIDEDENLVRKVSEADQRLNKLFDELEHGSLDTLETAARQIITLCTTLLGAFLGLLALKDTPAYLAFADVKGLMALALTGFLIALLLALNAVIPRRHGLSAADLTAKRRLLADLLQQKQSALNKSAWVFGAATLLMLLAALDILLFRL